MDIKQVAEYVLEQKGVSEAAAQFERLDAAQRKTAAGADVLTKQVQINETAITRLNSRVDAYARSNDPLAKSLANVERGRRLLNAAERDGIELSPQFHAALSKTIAKHDELTRATNDNTKAVGLQKYEWINLSRNLQDVGVSLAGGQNPLTVLMQQGSQISDVFTSSRGGAAAAMKDFGATVTRFALNPVTLLTAGLGGLAYAAYRYADQQETLNRSLNGIGRQSGATPQGLRSLSDTAARAGSLSQGQAIGAAGQYAAVGIGVENIGTLLSDTLRFSHAFGVDMDSAQKEIASIVSEEGLGALEKRFGPVSFATKEMVRSLEATGRYSEAAALKTRLLDEETQKARDSAGALQKVWESIIRFATTPVLGVGPALDKLKNGPSLDEQLQKARGDYFYLHAQRRGDASYYPGEREAEQRVRELERKRDEERNKPAQDQYNAALNRLSQRAMPTVDALNPDLTKLRQLKESFAELNKLVNADGGLEKLGDRADEARQSLSNLADQIGAWKSSADQLQFSTGLAVREIMARTFAERESVAAERARTQALQDGKGALYAAIAADGERAKMLAESSRKVDDLSRTSADSLRLAGMTPYERAHAQIDIAKRDFFRENVPDVARPVVAGFDVAAKAATRLADVLTQSAGRIGGATGPNPVWGLSGPNYSANDPRGLSSYIRERAGAYGIDPNVAMRVAASEGLGQFYGDKGTSFGAFQLHVGGGIGDEFRKSTGLDPGDPRNERATIDYALRIAAQRGWRPWHGAARVGVGEWEGIGAAGAAASASAADVGGKANKSFADQHAAIDVELIKNRFRDANNGIADQVRLLDAQRTALGSDNATMSGVIEAQKLLNYAEVNHIVVTDEVRRSIIAVSAAEAERYRKNEEFARQQRQLAEDLDIARGAVGGSISGGLKAIAHGENAGTAIKQSLGSLADRALDTYTGRFTEMLLGKSGSTEGGILGKLFGFGGQAVGQMSVNAANVVVSGGIGGVGNIAGGGGIFGSGGLLSGVGNFFSDLFKFSDGGLMTSAGPIPLHRYSSGGIASSPQLAMFGEGRVPEAYVPVPSGRIPVHLNMPAAAPQREPKMTFIDQSHGGVTVTPSMSDGQIIFLIESRIQANNKKQSEADKRNL